MKFKISYKDSRKTILLKLIYLIPFIFVAYIPSVILEGMKEIGNPFNGILEIYKEAK